MSAGQNAPYEVQEAIRRWENLPDGEKKKKPLLYWLLGSGTPPYKMPKDLASYQEGPINGQDCGNCEFAYKKVVRDRWICSQVSGPIQLDDWCRLWRAPLDV